MSTHFLVFSADFNVMTLKSVDALIDASPKQILLYQKNLAISRFLLNCHILVMKSWRISKSHHQIRVYQYHKRFYQSQPDL
jgi:hypothetical protein